MISLEARDMVYDFAAAYIRYRRILDEEPDLFKNSERKNLAAEAYSQARKYLFDYISELEAKAGVE